MKTNYISQSVWEIDSLKQKQIFLTQKYIWSELQDVSEINKSLSINLELINRWDKKDEKWELKPFYSINIFEIFDQIWKDEEKMKKVLFYILKDKTTITYNNQDIHFDDIWKRPNLKKAFWEQLTYDITLIMHDIIKYYEVSSQITSKGNEKVSISWEHIDLSTVSKFYSQQIMSKLIKLKRDEKLSWNEGQEIFDFLKEEFGDNIDENIFNTQEIKDLVWKYNFFKQIQNWLKNWYVFSHRELLMIEDILEDLNRWEIVLLTWDTWSWKTEIAKYICKYFLKKDYVFVWGSKELEVSDITLEKQVTSRSRLNNAPNIVDKKITDPDEAIKNQAESFFNEIIALDSFKKHLLEKATTKEQKDELEKEFKNWNLLQKSLITEYHYMWLYLAAKNWLPLIIDEVNIIRPEVLMALNDVITKKVWQKIQLPNALWDIEVKKWFCIILTWNDPSQNKKAWKYKAWRYEFDEAFYNRLRKYAKWYFNQTDVSKNEIKFNENSSTKEEIMDYLYDNEMYWIILMMIFSQDTKNMSSWKYGFEVMKKDFEWNFIDKNQFFSQIKSFSKAINKIQQAFSWEVVSLSWSTTTISLKDSLWKDVFSMRNLLQVLWKFKEDTRSLDYHIYREFIEKITNEDAKYALLLIFKEFGFFKDLITDNKNNSLSNIYKKITNLRETYKWISFEDINHKIIISKQDIYKEYFWNFSLNDEQFEASKDEIENLQKNIEVPNSLEWAFDNIEISREEVWELIDSILLNLINHTDVFSVADGTFPKVTLIFSTLKTRLDKIKNLKLLNSLLIKFTNLLSSKSDNFDEKVQMIFADLLQLLKQ